MVGLCNTTKTLLVCRSLKSSISQTMYKGKSLFKKGTGDKELERKLSPKF